MGLRHRFCHVPESPDPLTSFKGLHGNGPAYDVPGGQMGRAKDWHSRVTMNVGPDKLPGPSTGDRTRGPSSGPWHFGNFAGTAVAFAGAHKCTNPDVKEIL